jgi:hypothetical protein
VGDNLPTAFSSRNSVAIVRSLSVFAARSVTTVKFNIPHAPVCANLNRVNEIRPANRSATVNGKWLSWCLNLPLRAESHCGISNA